MEEETTRTITVTKGDEQYDIWHAGVVFGRRTANPIVPPAQPRAERIAAELLAFKAAIHPEDYATGEVMLRDYLAFLLKLES